jgi:hypothetical protein
MSSPCPLEVLAHGSCNGVHGTIVNSGQGGIVTSPGVGGTAGTYSITLDPGVDGNDVSILRSRVFITVTGATVALAGNIVKSVVAGLPPTVPLGGQLNVAFTIQTAAAPTVPLDESFDWVIYRDPTETTQPGT